MAEGSIDIEAIKRNATEQGVPLSEIAIFYEGLTEYEKDFMREQNLITNENGKTVIAKFTATGDALFPEKITGVYTLAA